jgi:hypothetical protein
MPDDIKSFARRVRHKIRPLPPQDSYPFISGDSYRLRCDVDMSNYGVNLDKVVSNLDPNTPHYIFVGGQSEAIFLLDHLNDNSCRANWTLVFHNRDIPPDEEVLFPLSRRVRRIYAEGWLGSLEIASPIPAGLENHSKLRNGVTDDWEKQARLANAQRYRKIAVFASFNSQNNISEREGISNIFLGLDSSFIPRSFLNPMQYRKVLLNSRYVVSPPGHGPDCHRTWEAIYSGAIPIVLERAWPFQHISLPVLVVKDWKDAVNYISEFPNPQTPDVDPVQIWNTFQVAI